MSRKLTFNRINTTEDTGDPVIRAELEDVGSRMDFIVLSDENLIRVWYVQSKHKGDMKIMLDEVTNQLGFNNVDFLEPDTSHELFDKSIEEVLDGFERKEEIVDRTSEGDPIKSTYLTGKWNNE